MQILDRKNCEIEDMKCQFRDKSHEQDVVISRLEKQGSFVSFLCYICIHISCFSGTFESVKFAVAELKVYFSYMNIVYCCVYLNKSY